MAPVLGGPRFQEGTRSVKDKLDRYSQERYARNGTYLGRGRGGSSQQTRIASECGPIRSRGRGMNQVKSSQCWVAINARTKSKGKDKDRAQK